MIANKDTSVCYYALLCNMSMYGIARKDTVLWCYTLLGNMWIAWKDTVLFYALLCNIIYKIAYDDAVLYTKLYSIVASVYNTHHSADKVTVA